MLLAREVGRELRESLNRAGLTALFVDVILRPLSLPGKVLSESPSIGWAELVEAACIAAHGDSGVIVRVAAAMESLAAGLDVLDEIEDGDHSDFIESVGLPQALNVSTALVFLSQFMISDLHSVGMEPKRITRLAQTLSRFGLIATSGQHRDLSTDARSGISLDESLQITREKSGALAACACCLGALLGTTDPENLQLYESFGRHYGTLVQLSNDLHDAQDDLEKTDLSNFRSTLPVVFYLRSVVGAEVKELNTADVVDSGALHFTWTVIEIQRQRCLAILKELDLRNQATARFRSVIGTHSSQKLAVDEHA